MILISHSYDCSVNAKHLEKREAFYVSMCFKYGKDELSWVKLLSAVLIFTGVYLVTQKKSGQ